MWCATLMENFYLTFNFNQSPGQYIWFLSFFGTHRIIKACQKYAKKWANVRQKLSRDKTAYWCTWCFGFGRQALWPNSSPHNHSLGVATAQNIDMIFFFVFFRWGEIWLRSTTLPLKWELKKQFVSLRFSSPLWNFDWGTMERLLGDAECQSNEIVCQTEELG